MDPTQSSTTVASAGMPGRRSRAPTMKKKRLWTCSMVTLS